MFLKSSVHWNLYYDHEALYKTMSDVEKFQLIAPARWARRNEKYKLNLSFPWLKYFLLS